jgi:hypothetical protein
VLAICRVSVAADGTETRFPVADVSLARPPVQSRVQARGMTASAHPPDVLCGGSRREDHVPFTGSDNTADPAPQWRFRLAGSVQGGIVVSGTVIVAASTAGEVAAFRLPADAGMVLPADAIEGTISRLWQARVGRVTGARR